jgi:alkylated DNA repair dioxygenase AlkB
VAGISKYPHSCSNHTLESYPLHYDQIFVPIFEQISSLCDLDFETAWCNLYHNGNEGMGYHSDKKAYVPVFITVANLTLGAERIFSLKHKKTKETIRTTLEHGSLLIMTGSTQNHWLHGVPKMKHITKPRISITMRKTIT